MLHYLRNSLRRKRARWITMEYPARVDVFDIPELGRVEFANWENPLARPVPLNPETIAFFRRFISPGDFVIDIGANIGDTTVPMGLAAGRKGLTLGFDPNPYVFKILERNASLNPDRTNIVPLPYAISSREEELFFVSSEASFSNGGVSRTRESEHGRFVHPEKVRAVELGKLLERDFPEWLPKLTFIKVDAEGHDAIILESIAELIDVHRPTVVAEVFGGDGREGKERLFRSLQRPGYELYFVGHFDSRAPTEPIRGVDDVIAARETTNICARPTGSEAR